MTAEAVLAALYLRGAPRSIDPPRRGWPQVLAALRRGGEGPPIEILQAAGASLPATVLATEGLLEWAIEATEAGKVLTAATEGYPLRWFEAFGDAAPPALWREGAVPVLPWIGAVGSRGISEEVRAFMEGIGVGVASLGKGLVSGGAMGCDTAAERAALAAGGAVLRILPHGIALRRRDDDALHLSLAAPDEPFSRPLAMERNALVYAAADATIVGHARMRQGGTWHGATDALRRRLGRVLVRDDGSSAFRALIALGAEPIATPSELAARLTQRPPPRSLFAYERRKRVVPGSPLV